MHDTCVCTHTCITHSHTCITHSHTFTVLPFVCHRKAGCKEHWEKRTPKRHWQRMRMKKQDFVSTCRGVRPQACVFPLSCVSSLRVYNYMQSKKLLKIMLRKVCVCTSATSNWIESSNALICIKRDLYCIKQTYIMSKKLTRIECDTSPSYPTVLTANAQPQTESNPPARSAPRLPPLRGEWGRRGSQTQVVCPERGPFENRGCRWERYTCFEAPSVTLIARESVTSGGWCVVVCCGVV